jgi:hypothetical protein
MLVIQVPFLLGREVVLDGEVKFVGSRDAVLVAAGTPCNLKNIGRRPSACAYPVEHPSFIEHQTR